MKKKGLRFYFALFFAKGTALVLKIIGRKGTSMPGSWAIILCPDFLDRIDKPRKIVGITGTNGKTTTTNFITDVISEVGEEFISNREGTNVATGIASCLVANSTLLGKQKKQLAIFEIDERSSPRILPYLNLDVLLVTNLFRDSYRRNAHVEYIFDLLDDNITKNTTLVLNADDPVCSNLGSKNKRVYFGIDKQEFENENHNSIINDGTNCPKCYNELIYDFRRYHHIGKYYCKKCGYGKSFINNSIVKADKESTVALIKVNEKEYDVKLLDANITNMYNQIAALSLLCEMGYSANKVIEAFSNVRIVESRLNEIVEDNKKIIRFMSKGWNPIACSRVLGNIANYSGKKCIILILEDTHAYNSYVENISWIYDADFEYLNNDEVNQIIIEGERADDIYIRLLLAGCSKDKIKQCKGYEKISEVIDYNKSDAFIICFNHYLVNESKELQLNLQKKIKDKCYEN